MLNCDNSINKERKLPKVKIKFGHVNARSLYTKLDEIHTVVKKHDFDVFCVCETWLGDQYKNNDVSIPGYNIFRKDRSDTKGGGVCIYVKDHFVVKTRNDLMFDEVEAI